jgi:hypothetical protein
MAVEFPQDVHRAYEPVLVGCVDLYRTPFRGLQSEDLRAEQRDIVIVDHVVPLAVEHLSNRLLL